MGEIISIHPPVCRDGDSGKPSFELLYEEYYEKVVSYLRGKLHNWQDAEDLAAESFAYCYTHYDDYDPSRSAPSTWIYLVVNSRLKNLYRDKRDHANFDELENLLHEEPDMDKAVYLEQLRGMLARALGTLPENQQKLVVMRYFEEQSFESIAESLGLTQGNARVILHRALKALEEYCNVHEKDWR